MCFQGIEVSILRDVAESVFIVTVSLSDVSQAIALCSRYILAIEHTERHCEPRNCHKPFSLINTGHNGTDELYMGKARVCFSV